MLLVGVTGNRQQVASYLPSTGQAYRVLELKGFWEGKAATGDKSPESGRGVPQVQFSVLLCSHLEKEHFRSQ